VSAPAFTAEQRAAIDDRGASSLLSANAGSGKTAVMAERFAEAVERDGAAVGAILAITFTEKAAGELRDRIRRRLEERGLEDEARAIDGAFIGTIHGFCSRVLRARPLAAGIDPRFAVLDEPGAQRLAERALDEALEAWVARYGPAALDVAAAYGEQLRPLVVDAYHALRSRGEAHPRLPVPPIPGAPDTAALAAAREEALRILGGAKDGKAVQGGRLALEACEAALAAAVEAVPLPHALAPAELKRNAAVLREPGCDDYREALSAYRQACIDHHAHGVLVAIDALLDRFGTAYAAAKAGRAAVDFADLELRASALLNSDAALRREWSERFALIMVDEFQDTNRVQLALLQALDRDNLFTVGDELQAIYGFRHADVEIFRERRAALAPARRRRLTANFRSAEELLDVLNGAFAPVFGDALAPLVAGRPSAPADTSLRLFDPDPTVSGSPPVELLVTDSRGWEAHEGRLGLAALSSQVWRRSEARLVAHRLRQEVDSGRRPGDVVVLVRATASLRLFEQALEEQGLPTYVVGGRGYWSQEQVRDGLAYLSLLASPLDEPALYTVLASPFCGVSADAMVLLAEAGRAAGDGAWAALRAGAPGLAVLPPDEQDRLRVFGERFAAERAGMERQPIEALLAKAVEASGYDVAILARSDGDRRLANLRKLMRLARDYERAEGRDLRGFLAYARAQDLREAREGEAALESEGLDAIRLMTIHRAKGLEFPVVCVADLGRGGGTSRPAVLVGADGRVGFRLATLGGGERVSAFAYDELAQEATARDDAEERRLLYVAMTRAETRLIVSGGADLGKPFAPRPGGPPLAWVVPALLDDPAAALAEVDTVRERTWDGRPARVRVCRSAPDTLGTVLPEAALAPARERTADAPGTHLPAAPKVVPAAGRAHPRNLRLSYSSLRDYGRCAYKFYLRRELGLPRDRITPEELAAWLGGPPAAAGAEPATVPALDAMTRGTIAHSLLERLDLARPAIPEPSEIEALAERHDVVLTGAEISDLQGLVAAFIGSALMRRLDAAQRVRREAAFAFALEPAGGGALINGFVDVYAEEADGGVLIVDYKSDRLGGAEPAELVERDYAVQRTVYALAALRAGAPHVEVAYCFLERPLEPVTAIYREPSPLQEHLVTLARGVLDGEYPVTERPHPDICGDCPGRRSLCVYASDGTFAGNGGPS
jgi:ATP-dependent exoDNAse (exonuclease V) beta subunit